MPVDGRGQLTYHLAVSGLITHAQWGSRHDWAVLRGMPVRRYEISMLSDASELTEFRTMLRPKAFGVHWPLYATDPRQLNLLQGDEASYTQALTLIAQRLRGTGAAYVLVHFPERGELWPGREIVGARLDALADLARQLGLSIALEPKETIIQAGGAAARAASRDAGMPHPGSATSAAAQYATQALEGRVSGFRAFAERVTVLPDGVTFCLDVSDWQTACDNGNGWKAPTLGASAFHLHARHVQPGGPFYRHAAPWVELRPEPGWTVRNVTPADLAALAARGRPVWLCLEIVHHYLDRLPAALTTVRRELARAGWEERLDD